MSAKPEHRENTYEFYKSLRSRKDPIFRHKDFDNNYVVARYEHVEQILKDPSFTPSKVDHFLEKKTTYIGSPDYQLENMPRILNDILLYMQDDEAHANLRKRVYSAFKSALSQKRHSLESDITKIAQIIIDDIISRETRTNRNTQRTSKHMDVIEDFSTPMTVHALLHLLGVKHEEWYPLTTRFRDVAASFFKDNYNIVEKKLMRGDESIGYLEKYFAGQYRGYKSAASSDKTLMAEFVANGLTEEEFVSICLFVLIAGMLTVSGLIGNGMLALLRNEPAKKEVLSNINDDTFMERFLEEIGRYDTPIQSITRVTRKTIDNIGGIDLKPEIEKNSLVLLLLGSANRDDQIFTDADSLNFSRNASRPPLTFAQDTVHECLGKPFAFLEAKIGFRVLLGSLRKPKIGDFKLAWWDYAGTRVLEHLYLDFE